MATILVAALLASSLTLKLVAGQSPPIVDTARPVLVSVLAQEGYRFGGETHSNDFTVAEFHRFDCSIKVVEASPSGWHEDLIQRLATPGDRVVFFFDGRAWDRQPRWRSWTYKHWRNANRLIGRTLPYRPVFGVITSSTCPLDDDAWAAMSLS